MSEYMSEKPVYFDELEVINEQENEKRLADGSVITEEAESHYTRKYPDGKVTEYREDDEVLLPEKEMMPDGRFVIYDYITDYDNDDLEDIYKQIKIYERDANGHYVYYKYEKDEDDEIIDDVFEKIEGNIHNIKELPPYIKLDDLGIIEQSDDQKTLSNGLLMKKTDFLYTCEYPNGKIATYHQEDEILLLKKETMPDGHLILYGYKADYDADTLEDTYEQIKIYEKDANGHYEYHKYETDRYGDISGDLLESGEGNIGEDKKSPSYLSVDDFEEFNVIEEIGHRKVLVDGSEITDGVDRYTHTYPSGKIAEYRLDDETYLLESETMPDGRFVLYRYKVDYDGDTLEDTYEQIKIYEKNANGDYTYYKYETDEYGDISGDLLETIEGNIREDKKSPTYMEIENFDDREVIKETKDQKILIDGSVLTDKEIGYVREYPNGKIATYHGHDDIFLLKKEIMPDGRVVIYDYIADYAGETPEETYKQVKIYEKDASGYYTYYKYEKDEDDEITENLLETIKGRVGENEEDQFYIDFESLDNLHVVEENGNQKVLAEGCVVSKSYRSLTLTYPSSKTAEYQLDEDTYLLETKTMPDGSIVKYGYKADYAGETPEEIYEPVKIYEKDAGGHYLHHEYEKDRNGMLDKLVETTEGNNQTWTKKISYDENENPVSYQKDGDETKKYYMSGQLMEETTDEGRFSYYETGVLQSETYENGVSRKYAPNKLLLFEEDEDENYEQYRLTSDSNNTLLLEKGDMYDASERYEYDDEDHLLKKEIKMGKGWLVQSYYPGPEQKLKTETKPDGSYTTWSEDGYITYERFADRSYKEYSSKTDYKKFDRRGNLLEEANALGRVAYVYYPETKQIEHIHKFSASGKELKNSYKHFDKNGKDNTKYYLARKRILQSRVDKEAEKARRDGVSQIQVMKKKSKFHKLVKLFDHITALKNSGSKERY